MARIPAGRVEGKNTENMLLEANDEYYGPAMEPVFPNDNGSVNTKAISLRPDVRSTGGQFPIS